MCNEKGKAAVVLTVIPRKGVGAHFVSAKDVDLLAYCNRLGERTEQRTEQRTGDFGYYRRPSHGTLTFLFSVTRNAAIQPPTSGPQSRWHFRNCATPLWSEEHPTGPTLKTR